MKMNRFDSLYGFAREVGTSVTGNLCSVRFKEQERKKREKLVLVAALVSL